MDYLKTLLSSSSSSSSSNLFGNGQLLRFAAHMSLFCRASSLPIRAETFVQLNESYAKFLMANSYKELVAYYLSQLSADMQVKYYAGYLQTVGDNKERLVLLKLAKERNMDVQAITASIVDTMSKSSSSSSSSSAIDTSLSSNNQQQQQQQQTQLNDDDMRRVNAIEWIVYDVAQRVKLLDYANLTMRHFLLRRQSMQAAKLIYAKIPHDTLSLILAQYNLSTTASSQASQLLNASMLATASNMEASLQLVIDNLPFRVVNMIKEHLCFKEYMEAIGLHNDWFEFYHRERPVKPSSADGSEEVHRVASERSFAERMTLDYEHKQYEDLKARWHAKALLYAERCKAKFMAVLRFPFGGWMVDAERSDEDESETSSDADDDDHDDDDTQMRSADEDAQSAPASCANCALSTCPTCASCSSICWTRWSCIATCCDSAI